MTEHQELEFELLHQTLIAFGYDFTRYAPQSWQRRVRRFLHLCELEQVSELIPLLLHRPGILDSFISAVSVNVTDMFRDPEAFKLMRHRLIPMLKSWPNVNIWHAGCASGEEVYSLVILLEEEGFYDKCQIFATDINMDALRAAQTALYPTENFPKYNDNYRQSGGELSLSDYFDKEPGGIRVKSSLLRNVQFSQHNLVCDGVIEQMHCIVCRNVFIYFNQGLQQEVLDLFDTSLCYGGFLCLGNKETLDFYPRQGGYRQLESGQQVYQKRYPGP